MCVVPGESMLNIIDRHDTLERIFLPWRLQLDPYYDAYKRHVYRMLNFTVALLDNQRDEMDHYGSPKEIEERIVVAACFHDVAIWLDGTFDYLAPSKAHACDWLREHGRTAWQEEVGLMIEYHHKLTAYTGSHAALVEAFRRGDLVDVSLGTMRSGLPRSFVTAVRKQFPNTGFHRFLAVGLTRYGLAHPFRPLPMMRR